MWFIFLGVGLTLLLIGGLYLRRRVSQALLGLGASPRKVRALRWLVVWLLYGYPLLTFISIFVALRLLGRPGLPRFDGPLETWLLILPFFLSLLVLVQSLPYLLVIDGVRAIGRWRARRRAAVSSSGPAPAGTPRLDRALARLTLVVVGAFTLYTPARIAAERGALRVRHWQLVGRGGAASSPSSSASPPSPAPPSQPFRIAFVADLQQDTYTGPAELRRVVDTINAAGADVVLSGGDWINTGPDFIAEAAATAGALQSRLGTFSVRGDHEHFAYLDRQRSVGEIERALTTHRVTMLNNEVRWFTHAGKRIGVLFLNYNYVFRTDDAIITALVGELAGADYSILVTHQLNEHVAALVRDRVDLVLAAHTHGGQVNPVIGLVHVPLARLETRYIDGRYQLGATTILTTAGVGFSIVPFRYASPGSLELIELRL